MATEEEIAAARAAQVAAEAAALRTAEDAATALNAARAGVDAEREALKQKVAALEAKLAPPVVAPVPEGFDEVRAFVAREKNTARINTIRQMGFQPKLSDADLLKILPDADPTTADGLAKFEAWRAANSGSFTPPGQPASVVIDSIKSEVEGMGKGNALFSAAKLMTSVFGGGGKN